MLEGKFTSGIHLFKRLIDCSILGKHKPPECWGLLGLLYCLLMEKKLSEAKVVAAHYEKIFSTTDLSFERMMFVGLKAEILIQNGMYLEGLQMAEDALNIIKTKNNDIYFYALPTYQMVAKIFLTLWEGK